MSGSWRLSGGWTTSGGWRTGGHEDGGQSSCAAQSPGDREAEAVSTDEYIAIVTKIKWEETNQGKYLSDCTQHLRFIY